MHVTAKIMKLMFGAAEMVGIDRRTPHGLSSKQAINSVHEIPPFPCVKRV